MNPGGEGQGDILMESLDKQAKVELPLSALRISEQRVSPREGRAAMTLKLNGNTRIDNLRNYPAEIVEKLRSVLASGARAYPDPHCKAFYDLEDGCRMFYIHVSPTGKVWLLASWIRNAPAMARA